MFKPFLIWCLVHYCLWPRAKSLDAFAGLRATMRSCLPIILQNIGRDKAGPN